MAKEVFRIAYPKTGAEKKKWAKEYGMNAYYAGKHWALRKKDAELWHWLTLAAMNAQGIRRTPFKLPVAVTFYWNDRLDIDNHAIMGKMIVDAMKEHSLNKVRLQLQLHKILWPKEMRGV